MLKEATINHTTVQFDIKIYPVNWENAIKTFLSFLSFNQS